MSDATRNQPVTLQIQHDGVDTLSYTLLVNGVEGETKLFESAGVNFQFAEGFAPGVYNFQCRANGSGISAAGTNYVALSEQVTLVVAAGAPAQPRIVIVVG